MDLVENQDPVKKSSFDYICVFCTKITVWDNYGPAAKCQECGAFGTNKTFNCYSCKQVRYLYLQSGNRCFDCIEADSLAPKEFYDPTQLVSETCPIVCHNAVTKWEPLIKNGL